MVKRKDLASDQDWIPDHAGWSMDDIVEICPEIFYPGEVVELAGADPVPDGRSRMNLAGYHLDPSGDIMTW